jgi:hypothetical protein
MLRRSEQTLRRKVKKRAKMGPKWGQDEAKRGQDGANMWPRGAKMGPKWGQDGARMGLWCLLKL